MHILVIIMLAISLSMDAFSLSLAYGTSNLNRTVELELSGIVGLFHFFMPLTGLQFGHIIFNYIPIRTNIIVFLILVFIGFQMLVDSLKEETIKREFKLLDLILFAFAVSLDSFSLGISLYSITTKYVLSCSIFMLSSSIFTYIGLKMGKIIENKLGTYAQILGGIILIIIGITYII